MMKRTLAIFLALLLLLPLMSCKEAKNYTVKEVDGYRTIVLDPSEVPKINQEMDEQGYSITKLKGFEDDDFSASYNHRWEPHFPGNEKSLVSRADIVAKCDVIKKEVIRIDYNDYIERAQGFGVVYTMKIKELLYTDGEEKEGDMISIYYHLQRVYMNGYEASLGETGSLILNAPLRAEPTMGVPCFVFAYRTKNNPNGEKESSAYTAFTAMKAAATFTWYDPYSTIYEIAPNEYELHSKFTSLTEGAEVIPEDERTTWLDMRVKTDDFNQRMEAMLQKYGK